MVTKHYKLGGSAPVPATDEDKQRLYPVRVVAFWLVDGEDEPEMFVYWAEEPHTWLHCGNLSVMGLL